VSYPAWDIQAKGIWDGSAALRPFWIQRYYCKHSRRTVSLLPTFCHTRKRYPLSVAVPCIASVVEDPGSITTTAKAAGVNRKTLKSWLRGWERHEQDKRLAFFSTGSDPSIGCGFGKSLLNAVRAIGSSGIVACIAEAMLRLTKNFDCPLY
jgi:hypothetical protein